MHNKQLRTAHWQIAGWSLAAAEAAHQWVLQRVGQRLLGVRGVLARRSQRRLCRRGCLLVPPGLLRAGGEGGAGRGGWEGDGSKAAVATTSSTTAAVRKHLKASSVHPLTATILASLPCDASSAAAVSAASFSRASRSPCSSPSRPCSMLISLSTASTSCNHNVIEVWLYKSGAALVQPALQQTDLAVTSLHVLRWLVG